MIIFHIHEPELQKASQAKSETDCRNKNERLKLKERISRMKAGRIHFYGGPEQLVYEDASQPHPVKNQVLIRVYAAGVTATKFSWEKSSWQKSS